MKISKKTWFLLIKKANALAVALALTISMFPAGLSGFNFAFADDSGFSSPTSITSPNGEWASASNAFVSDNSYAVADSVTDDQGYRDFNLAVPGASTIDGIEVTIETFSTVSQSTAWSDSFGTSGSNSDNISDWEEEGNDSDDTTLVTTVGNDDDTESGLAASPNGGRFAKIGQDEWICRSVSSGYTGLTLKYYWRGDNDAEDNEDYGYVEYSSAGTCDSASWTTVATHELDDGVDGGAAWSTEQSVALPNGTTLVRFRQDSTTSAEHFRIDGVSVTGYVAREGELEVRISGNGNPSFSDYKQQVVSGTEAVYTLGGSSDLWGESWTPSSFTNSNFRLEIGLEDLNSGETISLDHVAVKVYYTPDACDDTFTYEKSSDFSDIRTAINFHDSDEQIDVSAQSGYHVTEVWLDVENDGYGGYHLYATGPLTNFNPPHVGGGGNDINEAKVVVKKVCNGTLQVKKVIVGGHEGDGPEDFSFTVESADEETVATQAFENDGQNDLSLAPDTYTVTELTAPGWVTTYNNCADVSLALGETKTCTITNTKLGSITINKVTNPGSVAQPFAYTATGDGVEGFTLDTDSSETYFSSQSFTSLEAGEYSFTEGEVPGYVLTGISCTVDGEPLVANVEGSTVSVEVANTEDVACTYTNERLPILTIYKYASPLDTSFDIAVNAPGEEPDSVFVADVAGDGEANSGSTYHYVALGDYTLTETLPDGWGANGTGGKTTVVCYKNGVGSLVESTSVTTTLGYGDVAQCIFNNTPNSS